MSEARDLRGRTAMRCETGRRWCFAGLAALAALLGAQSPAAAQMEKATLSLPADGMHFLALYAAEDFHFLEQQGLELKTVFIAGIGSFNAVVSGAADFSVGSGASLAR